jgi:hypothetical protein
MPRLSIETSHTLDEKEALRRLKDKVDALKQTYDGQYSDLREQWDGNVFSFAVKAAGMKLAGTGKVEAARVRLDVDVPLAIMVFKSMIRSRVREELDSLLA